MPPLPGGSHPGRTCVCVVWKQDSAARQCPRYVMLSHVRVPWIQPGILPLLPSCSHKQLAGQTGGMWVSPEFLLF